MNRVDIHEELRQAQNDFHQLVAGATPQDLHRRSDGTRWTNRQLLWHMVFGYLIGRTLMPPVHMHGRLGWSRRFAAILNALYRPFHLINYAGSAGAGLLQPPRGTAAIMDATINALDRRLAAETPASLALTMHFPTRWDPYFRDSMSVLDVYHYGAEHHNHHHRPLTSLL